MTKIFTVLSLVFVVTLVAVTMIGIPGPSVLRAQEESRVDSVGASADCRLVEVALDEGYGVTRRVVRSDCSSNQ